MVLKEVFLYSKNHFYKWYDKFSYFLVSRKHKKHINIPIELLFISNIWFYKQEIIENSFIINNSELKNKLFKHNKHNKN